MAGPDLEGLLQGSTRLRPGEMPLASAKPSPRLLWGELLQAATVIGLTLLFARFVPIPAPQPFPDQVLGNTLGLGAVGVELLYLGPRVLLAAINVFFTTYTLTSERIYARTEFISTDLKIVPYEKVTVVRLRRTLAERLLGVTELSVQGYGAFEGRVRMRGLLDPLPLFQETRRRIREHNSAAAIVRSD